MSEIKKLYKYLPAESIKYILKDRTIKFASYLDLNDPFEFNPSLRDFNDNKEKALEFFKFCISRTDTSELVFRYIPLLEKPVFQKWLNDPFISKALRNKNGNELLEFGEEFILEILKDATTTDPDISNFFKPPFKLSKKILSKIGILCLTQTWNNLKMWAHYAQKFTGFVVEFNINHSFFKVDNTSSITNNIHKVVYINRRPIVSGYLMDKEEAMAYLKNYFLTKGSVWREEKEIRFLKDYKSHNGVGIKYYDNEKTLMLYTTESFDSSLIKSITMGVNITPSDKEDIQRLLSAPEYKHVVLYQARLCDEKYRLKRDRIKL